MGVGGQDHAPAALPLGMTRYPLSRTLGGPQGWIWTGAENLCPLGFDTRTVQHVVSRHTNCAMLAHGYITRNENFFLIILFKRNLTL